MITCPACGKENEESAALCRRCRAPLRDEPEEELAPPEAEHHSDPAHHEAAHHEPAHHEPAHHEPAHHEPAHHEPAHHALQEQPAATADEPTASSDSLGEVCRRCESYNEPGARRCSSCGYVLIAEDAPAGHEPVHHAPPLADEPPLDKTPAQPYSPVHHAAGDEDLVHDTPPEGIRSVADELSALAISPEEAAEAGLSLPSPHAAPHEDDAAVAGAWAEDAPAAAEEPPLDKTPPQAFRPPREEPPREEPPPSLVAKSKVAVAEAAGVAAGVAAGAAAIVAGAVRRAPSEPPPPEAAPPPAAPAPPAPKAEPEQKACAECGALNPPAAKFCFDCGTPFAKKSAAPPAPKPPEPAAATPAEPQRPPPQARPPEPPRPAEPHAVEPPKPAEPPKPSRASAPAAVAAPAAEPARPEASLKGAPAPRPAAAWADSTEPGMEAPAIHPDDGAMPALHDATAETPPLSLPLEPSEAAHEAAGGHEDHAAATDSVHFDEAASAAHEEAASPGLDSGEAAAGVHFEEAAAHHEDAAPAAFEEAPGALADPLAAEPPPEESQPPGEPVEAVEELEPAEAIAPPVEELGEPLPEEEPPPPFAASLVLEKGPAAGTAIQLGRLENTVGGAGAAVELADDPAVAPHAATVAFAGDRLIVRDEGSSNGVYVRVRETAAVEPGDHFFAGERLLRFDGPCELPQTHAGEVPFLGAPRPAGPTVRVTELVAGGKTGRTCHRAGPTISIGRTGCDMNFPADSLLAARHAELRLGDDGSVSLVDLGQGPSGVFVRIRAQGTHELQGGDVLRVGEQELRVEIG